MSDLSTDRAAAPADQSFPSTDEYDCFPLSFAQERLWFLDQYAPGSAAYNVPLGVRLSGQLDRAALAASLQTIIVRHETLRTSFVVLEGEPMQLIVPAAALPLELISLAELPAEQRAAALQRQIDARAEQPFDLRRGPVMRATLFQIAADQHVLLLVLHHIICDGWSMGVLMRELAAGYTAAAQEPPGGLPVELPALAIQYADYAVWQRAQLADDGPDSLLAQQLQYWRDQLADLPPRLALPSDYPQPAAPTWRAASETLQLPAALTAALHALSTQERATLFMTLLAAWQTLLARYSGQDDIVVGSPIANRTTHELEPLIGFFVNMLVLRADVSDNPPFRVLLGRVRETCLQAYAHQDLPFDKLVEAVQPWRSTSRSPLFSVAFALQNAPLPPLALPGVRAELLPIGNISAKYDLTFTLFETADGLTGALEYSTDLFEPGTIAGMLEHYATLLEGITADPDQRLADLPLLTAAERRLLEEWGNS